MKKVIFALAILLTSNAALAGCSTADLDGYWDYYEGNADYALTCSLRIRNGTVSLHQQFGCKGYGNTVQGVGSITGNLRVDQFCHVAGSLIVDGTTLSILKSTMNQSRSTIQGIGQGPFVYATFTMVKFW